VTRKSVRGSQPQSAVTPRPRVLFVGRTRYALPLDESLRRKFDALQAVLDVRVLGSAPAGSPSGDETFRLVRAVRPRLLDGVAYHLCLPFRAARELRRFEPDAVVVQGAHEAAAVLLGRALARSGARVVLDVHGDWRTATRLYGSPARRLLNPVADRLAALAVRRADAVRTISDYTTGLVRQAGAEPAAVFPAFMDLEPFLERPPEPLPERPAALFVGVLELYKNVDGLVEAWRLAAPRIPEAELRIVGKGPRAGLVSDLVDELPGQASWRLSLTTEEVARALDEATVLVLPSRSEGMGRVIVEALCRGRPVVASRVGGIRDLVHDGENGVLVEPGDPEALADALVRVLSDRALAERLAARARPSVEGWLATPEQYAERMRALVSAL
jgi:glycosyltransferase involved in cell wall biosynthesis